MNRTVVILPSFFRSIRVRAAQNGSNFLIYGTHIRICQALATWMGYSLWLEAEASHFQEERKRSENEFNNLNYAKILRLSIALYLLL